MNAHPLSMSRATLRLDGGIARLEIRVPKLEMDHVAAANRDLPMLYRLNGEPPVSRDCRIEAEDFICNASFLVQGGRLVAHTVLPEAILPHHIHTLTFEGRNFVFTPSVTQHDLQAGRGANLWWIVAIAAVVLIVIGSLRLRRKILRPG